MTAIEGGVVGVAYDGAADAASQFGALPLSSHASALKGKE